MTVLSRLVVFFSVFISLQISAQSGSITGKVISATSGQPLSNASLTLVEKSATVAADQNGSFSFGKLAPGTYSIKCSYVGFNVKIIEEIIVKGNEATSINVSLDEKKTDDGNVVVTARVRAARETVSSLLTAQKNSASVSDGVSFEQIKRTPDRTTSDVLKRVSGASIQDDRFAIIRGLNDRYNAAFLNGAALPSTESDRKAFAFDVFPSSILDNLVIYKTATPDMSGEFAGGIINITTKSIPAKNFTSISIGGGYNTLLTGNDRFYSENKGKTDWLGIDDGTRAIPAGIPGAQELRDLTFAEKAEKAKLFGNYKWGVKHSTASPNFNFQVSQGLNIKRKGDDFVGALFSVTYNKTYTFNEGERNTFDFDVNTPSQPAVNRGKYRDSVYNEETVWAAMANLSLKLNNRNNISFKNNFSVNTDNRLFKRFGNTDFDGDNTFFARDEVRWFTSNKIFSSQLIGEHQLATAKTKINWTASYSKVNREIPNLSRTSYIGYLPDLLADHSGTSVAQNTGSGTMFFTNSNESISGIKADLSQPFTFMKSAANLVKLGGGYQYRQRDFTSRLLGFVPYEGVTFDYTIRQLPIESIYKPENLGLKSDGIGGFMLNDGTIPNSNYRASSSLSFAYLMGDQRFFTKFRLIYGARLESFKQTINSLKLGGELVDAVTTVTDLLPSVNLVYAVTPKINLRLSYGKTINRPEFRELAPYLFYDFATLFTYEGFDTLKRATINNYDFRFEFFPGKAQLFSVSAFYKDFTNPIEIVSNPVFDNLAVYSNSKSAKVYGVEAEFRTLLSTILGVKSETGILSKFTLAANAALMKSEVKLGSFGFFDPALLVTDRALQGQSPYLINGSLGYNSDKLGLSSTLSVNRVGDRVNIAGTVNRADIYERARTVMDFQLTKNFIKNKMEVKFNIRDLLAQKMRFYYDFDKSKNFTDNDRYFSSFTMPKVITLTLSYKF